MRRLVLIGLAISVACSGGGEAEETASLRFEALPAIAESEVAPLESYRARDGAELPMRYYPAESQTTLLLVHGSAYHSRYLAPLAHRLAASGAARVYTPDLRGHGQSPERRGDIDYIDQLEDDLADLVAHVRERHRASRIVIGGHSSGGGLAVRFAGSRHQELPDGYLLLAPFLGHDAPTTRENAGGWARPRLPVIISLSILDGFGITALNGTTALTFAMPESARDGSETLSYSFRLMTGFAPRDYRNDLADVSQPMLALIGAEDEAFLPEKLAPTLSFVSTATVEILLALGHLDLPGAPAAADAITRWLGGL
jgi:alpha-beta hydrolase superfamily lysophospholipase